MKATIRLAEDFRRLGQLGRLRASLLIGVALADHNFLRVAEKAGLLMGDNQPPRKFHRFLTEFRREVGATHEPRWSSLHQRLNTYEVYQQFLIATAHHEVAARQVLTVRPRHVIKQLLALAGVSFLHGYFQMDVPPEVEDLVGEFDSPEELAGVVSLLVALANAVRPIDSWDLASPAIDPVNSGNLAVLLSAGRVLVQRRAVGKYISLFGYHFERGGKGQTAYYLRPWFADFERTLRLGYIRSEVASQQALVPDEGVPSIPALADIARMLVTKGADRIQEIRDPGTRFRRVRTNFPLIPELYSFLMEHGFHEDRAYLDRLEQDFLLPEADSPIPLTPSVTIREFLQMWRIVQFFCLVDIAAIRSYSTADQTIFLNSAVRITKEDEILEVLATAGADRIRAREFLGLVTAEVGRLGHFDMQYWPFLRIAPGRSGGDVAREIVHVPAITATANIFRNLQVANQTRLQDLPDLFVDVVARMLRTRFGCVITNRRIQTPTGNTDIDVIVLESEHLYLFECKHSVFPTEPHEVRDVWEDVEKGVRQLHVASEAFEDRRKLRDYLAGWFPGRRLDTKRLVIHLCVLNSHRFFSGMDFKGIPVRDYSSLSRLVDSGVVDMGSREGDGVAMRRVRVTDDGGFSREDLDNYLGATSKFFTAYLAFMNPVSRIERLGRITLARETYVYEIALDEWLAHMEAVGAKRLPDQHQKLSAPARIDEVLGS